MGKKIDKVFRYDKKRTVSGAITLHLVLDEEGYDLMRPLKVDEVKPDTEGYYIRTNKDLNHFIPTYLSRLAEWKGIVSLIKHEMLFIKDERKQKQTKRPRI